MDNKQQAFYFWISQGMAGATKSSHRLLLLCCQNCRMDIKNKVIHKNLNLPPAIQPFPHCDELPIPVFHGFHHSETESESKSLSEESDR